MARRTARTIRIFSLKVSPNLVSLNTRKLDFHKFRHILKVTLSQNTFKWVPKWGPQGPLPWDPLCSQGFPSHGGSGTPSHGIPLGSQGFPLPWVPSHGIPLGSQGSLPMGSHPIQPCPTFVRLGEELTTSTKDSTRGLAPHNFLQGLGSVAHRGTRK